MMDKAHDCSERIVILDAGSQFGKVIDRRVRELCVESEIWPIDTPGSKFRDPVYKGIIISGGPQSVYAEGAPKLGSEKKLQREDGQFSVEIDVRSALFKGLEPNQTVLLTHGDTVLDVPDDWKVIGHSGNMIAAVEHSKKKLYGVQFHPEVDLTENGRNILRNFLYEICGCRGKFTLENRRQLVENELSKVSSHQKVMILVSGGVDSTVCAVLCKMTLGTHRVHALHIDTGFLRENESQMVRDALNSLDIDLKILDISEQMYSASTLIRDPGTGLERETGRLDETLHPEEKRRIIGDTFMKVAQDEISRMGMSLEDIFLVQGTLRPDLIESASKTVSQAADVIKTHHNDTALVRELREKGHILEPLSSYHKDEVRALGLKLGLPEELVWRQPFPGPGLAIRIICADKPIIGPSFYSTNQKLHYLMNCYRPDDPNLPPELRELRPEEKNLVQHLAETRYFSAHLLPILTVGVQGDARTYKHVCAISSDGHETPRWSELFSLAKLLPKLYHDINRVVYMFGSRLACAPTCVTPTRLTREVVEKLRIVDHLFNTTLKEQNQYRKISQAPVVLFPLAFDGKANTRSVAIRTIITNDFMTGRPARPGVDISEESILASVRQIEQVPGIARVVYDLTSKPPATTEWE
ncbi:GMP synthase [glutamine-hydrolyzing]-like isoform X2 [Schistocerca gregaria]|uniref:GMP synthase [glutamine-hydrolyzing]-like isoform X2 n=1 Tax=Schistocerca gregaria TaxID=7010 RepID=UPI00211F421A|nr:GMP synthase [glutamine-hydrolyzing]-like isoform X2 [Schistocerca gregaria]